MEQKDTLNEIIFHLFYNHLEAVSSHAKAWWPPRRTKKPFIFMKGFLMKAINHMVSPE